MKVLFLTIGDETVASSRVRVFGYIPFLKERGIGYKIIPFTSKSKCKRLLGVKNDNIPQYLFEIFYKIRAIAILFALVKAYDIIYLQKTILPRSILRILKKFNKRIIFDFDDAIYLYKDITYILKSASRVVVSNKNLKEFASGYNKEVYELISPVSVTNQPAPKQSDAVILGWIGSPETSRYLVPLIPVFKGLKEKFKNLDIEFMGAKKNRFFGGLDLRVHDWSIEGEKGYLEKIDVGIMPLEDNDWTRSKGGYKLLLYMSKGVPCIASPVGINKQIVKDGITGYFANSKEEWFEKLSILLKDKKLRKQIGRESWLRANKYYSYEVNVPKFLKVVE